MKYFFFIATAFSCLSFIIKPVKKIKGANVSPLSSYSKEWDKAEYLVCNTAANANYMTAEEKKLICILNMARMNPQLFCSTVVKKYPTSTGQTSLLNTSYYKSLVKTMNSMKKMGLLQPDMTCYTSAQCHAATSGSTGYTGHERQTDSCLNKRSFNGECCDYGHDQALDILMSLLIDNNVPSLGHRTICLYAYKTLGVSIQPHITWRHIAVMDFRL